MHLIYFVPSFKECFQGWEGGLVDKVFTVHIKGPEYRPPRTQIKAGHSGAVL